MKLILDTDIGTDIDDAYALAMLFNTPIELIGVSTVSGNTLARAQIAAGLLRLGGRPDIPIFAGPPSRSPMTQAEWAASQPVALVEQRPEKMADFYWDAINTSDKSQLCIAAIGPLTNIAAIRSRDPVLFDKRVRLVYMGGSIRTGYMSARFAMPEYNIAANIKAAKALFDASIEMDIFPLDSTQDLKFEEKVWQALQKRAEKDALAQALVDLTLLFKRRFMGATPVLFDPAALAVLVDPEVANPTMLDLEIRWPGMTRVRKPQRGAEFWKKVYLEVNREKFYHIFAGLICPD